MNVIAQTPKGTVTQAKNGTYYLDGDVIATPLANAILLHFGKKPLTANFTQYALKQGKPPFDLAKEIVDTI